MKNHKIVIGGSTFMIRSDVEETRIREIEDFLNSDLDRLMGRGSKVPFTDALVLMLFKQADTLMDRQQDARERIAEAAREARSIRSEMEEIRQMVTNHAQNLDDGAS